MNRLFIILAAVFLQAQGQYVQDGLISSGGGSSYISSIGTGGGSSYVGSLGNSLGSSSLSSSSLSSSSLGSSSLGGGSSYISSIGTGGGGGSSYINSIGGAGGSSYAGLGSGIYSGDSLSTLGSGSYISQGGSSLNRGILDQSLVGGDSFASSPSYLGRSSSLNSIGSSINSVPVVSTVPVVSQVPVVSTVPVLSQVPVVNTVNTGISGISNLGSVGSGYYSGGSNTLISEGSSPLTTGSLGSLGSSYYSSGSGINSITSGGTGGGFYPGGGSTFINDISSPSNTGIVGPGYYPGGSTFDSISPLTGGSTLTTVTTSEVLTPLMPIPSAPVYNIPTPHPSVEPEPIIVPQPIAPRIPQVNFQVDAEILQRIAQLRLRQNQLVSLISGGDQSLQEGINLVSQLADTWYFPSLDLRNTYINTFEVVKQLINQARQYAEGSVRLLYALETSNIYIHVAWVERIARLQNQAFTTLERAKEAQELILSQVQSTTEHMKLYKDSKYEQQAITLEQINGAARTVNEEVTQIGARIRELWLRSVDQAIGLMRTKLGTRAEEFIPQLREIGDRPLRTLSVLSPSSLDTTLLELRGGMDSLRSILYSNEITAQEISRALNENQMGIYSAFNNVGNFGDGNILTNQQVVGGPVLTQQVVSTPVLVSGSSQQVISSGGGYSGGYGSGSSFASTGGYGYGQAGSASGFGGNGFAVGQGGSAIGYAGSGSALGSSGYVGSGSALSNSEISTYSSSSSSPISLGVGLRI